MDAHADPIILIPPSKRDPALPSVRKIGHATFTTPDLDRLVDYYTEVIGLQLMDRNAGRAYLASTLERHSLVLEQGREAACTALAFQVPPGTDLASYATQLGAMGVAAGIETDSEPGIAQQLRMTDPKGTSVSVYAEREFSPQRFLTSGIVPHKLGHIAFTATDIKTSVNWYIEALGFRMSDWLGEIFAFMRCGPDHHTVNILQAQQNRMHHIAFELMDWAHIQRACDILARNGYPLLWGPGRHGIGHNIFIYHRNPDEHIIELFTDLDRIDDEALNYFEPRPWHHDRPQRPKVWTPNIMAANLWGVPPPEGFMD